MNGLNIYKQTKDVLNDVKHIIESSQKQAYQAVNTTLILRNCKKNMGKVIQNQIYIIFIYSIKCIQTFSNQ